jgi:hypothetical protein
MEPRQEHFVINREAVVLGSDGVSDFDALHSGKHNARAQLFAFDMGQLRVKLPRHFIAFAPTRALALDLGQIPQ